MNEQSFGYQRRSWPLSQSTFLTEIVQSIWSGMPSLDVDMSGSRSEAQGLSSGCVLSTTENLNFESSGH
jgi:hypothetical protein